MRQHPRIVPAQAIELNPLASGHRTVNLASAIRCTEIGRRIAAACGLVSHDRWNLVHRYAPMHEQYHRRLVDGAGRPTATAQVLRGYAVGQ
jgi:hypothetical protein